MIELKLQLSLEGYSSIHSHQNQNGI
jgi:hypothetical protein